MTIAWVLAVCVGLPGCSGTRTTSCGHITPVGEITIKLSPPKCHVKIPAGLHGKITFKDKDGNTIPGSTIEGDGPIDADFPLPENAASYDWELTDKPTPQPAGFSTSPQTMAGTIGIVQPFLSNYSVNCTSNFIDDITLHGFSHGITTKAASSTSAWSKFGAVSVAGPGGVVASGTQVDTWVDVQGGPVRTTIGSALQDNFATFTLTVDGVVVADLATNLNVIVQPLANGWTKIWTALPSSLGASNSIVLLTQKGASATAAETTIDIANL